MSLSHEGVYSDQYIKDTYPAIYENVHKLSWRVEGKVAIYYSNPEYTKFIRDNQKGKSLDQSGTYTIADTEGGKYLRAELAKLSIPDDLNTAFWAIASERYAKESKGHVIGLVFDGHRGKPMFRSEHMRDEHGRILHTRNALEVTNQKQHPGLSSIWIQRELPTLLENRDVSTLNGIPRVALLEKWLSSGKSKESLLKITKDIGDASLTFSLSKTINQSLEKQGAIAGVIERALERAEKGQLTTEHLAKSLKEFSHELKENLKAISREQEIRGLVSLHPTTPIPKPRSRAEIRYRAMVEELGAPFVTAKRERDAAAAKVEVARTEKAEALKALSGDVSLQRIFSFVGRAKELRSNELELRGKEAALQEITAPLRTDEGQRRLEDRVHAMTRSEQENYQGLLRATALKSRVYEALRGVDRLSEILSCVEPKALSLDVRRSKTHGLERGGEMSKGVANGHIQGR